MVDERERAVRDAALSWRERWIQNATARRTGDRRNAHEWEALVADNFRITDDNTRTHTVFIRVLR